MKRWLHSLLLLGPIAIMATGCLTPPGSQVRTTSLEQERKDVVRTALQQIGTRYRMGGSSPATGFDCSGLALYVYGKHGIKLPHSARAQFQAGKQLTTKQIRPGDLLFFNINGRGISHVGIYIGGGRFVHAPSSGKTVRTDEVRNPYWKKRYRGGAGYL